MQRNRHEPYAAGEEEAVKFEIHEGGRSTLGLLQRERDAGTFLSEGFECAEGVRAADVGWEGVPEFWGPTAREGSVTKLVITR